LTSISPLDVATQETLAYLRRVLQPPPRRVLEVGPGRANLAARLQALGYAVTAVDPDPAAVQLARQAGIAAVQADFLALTEGGWDVVLFTRSLHHLADLSRAVEHARRLLAPGGTLVADEFARERANRATAAFFYGLRALLQTAGVLQLTEAEADAEEDEDEAEAATDSLERWRARHAGRPGHPLHESGAMLGAVRACFPVVKVELCAYLYRALGEQIVATEQGFQLTRRLLALEQRLIQAGSLAPVGLRLQARRGTD
jgi:SAM-dependent methyltransferase